MYKKILVPLDGSNFSESNLDDIKSMATKSNVPEIVLVMILEPDYSFAIGELAGASSQLAEKWFFENEYQSKTRANAYLEDVAQKLRKAGLPVTTDIIFGNPAKEITSYAHKNDVDLIVITNLGKGVPRWAIGKAAEELVRRAAASVLILSPIGKKASVPASVCSN
jgi:nucleotide-binding universal stress UspA family protein